MASKNALVVASIVDSLIGGFRSHVHARSLPAPAYVQLDVRDRQVVIQPQHQGDLATELTNLLVWARTLDEVSARWWRTTAERLHVTVEGRTAGGLRLKIYTGALFSETAGMVHLEPDQSEDVSLDELSTLAALLGDAHDDQEGA